MQKNMPDIPKPKIFIGCTTETYNRNIASAVQANMQTWAHPEIWNQGTFELSNTYIEDLEKKLRSFDAAVFLFEGDDTVTSRNEQLPAVRDNLLVEFGMCLGIMGRNRTFFIKPQGLNVKIASDLHGMSAGTYDPTHDNLEAALHPSTQKIQKQLERLTHEHSEDVRKFAGKPQLILDYTRHVNRIGQSREMEAKIQSLFSAGMIRSNWIIDLEYDFSKLHQDILTEKIIWKYDLINLTNRIIPSSMKLLLYKDKRNSILAYNITDAQRNTISLLEPDEVIDSKIFKTMSKKIDFKPGESYSVYMQFQQNYNVSKRTCRFHNCFAPREPTLGVTVRARIPKNYVMDVLGVDPLKPANLGDTYDYIIDDVLMPEQVIEYTFERQSAPKKKKYDR